MKKTLLILLGVFFLTVNIVSATDVLVWQGQYYTGTVFNIGTYEFNFSVYDALTGGNICFSNTTALTTGNFGEWKTEQIGVNFACNDTSMDYFLNINIDGADQLPRKRLRQWNFLRKDVDEVTLGKLEINTQIITPVINASEITITNNANILGVLRGHSPVKIGNSIQFVDENDTNLFSVYTAGLNITGSNVSSNYYGVIVHQIETHTNPSGIEECWWDMEDQEMRMCMDETNIEMWNSLLVHKNITSTANVSANTGVFDYLGELTNRITNLFIQDIDASGNVNVSGNVTASNFIGNGSLLTNLPVGDELIPVYLESDLNATDAAYITIFTIALTPGKMNIVQVYLAQSTSTTGVAVQNRVIVNESGPVGYCNFVTQTGGADGIDTIALSNNSADTEENTLSLDIDIPFINTVVCTVVVDASPKNLIVQFDSEQIQNVTTYAGSYYTNAVR